MLKYLETCVAINGLHVGKKCVCGKFPLEAFDIVQAIIWTTVTEWHDCRYDDILCGGLEGGL